MVIERKEAILKRLKEKEAILKETISNKPTEPYYRGRLDMLQEITLLIDNMIY